MDGDLWLRHMTAIDPLRIQFFIWNIYETNSHNTARIEQICWQLDELEIYPDFYNGPVG